MIWPRLGRSMSATSFRSVLLPAPEGPVRKAISPRSTSKDTSERASLPPSYRLLTDWKLIMRLSYQGFGEGLGVEGRQVLGGFADADEADGDAETGRSGQHDAALGGAVQ